MEMKRQQKKNEEKREWKIKIIKQNRATCRWQSGYEKITKSEYYEKITNVNK